MVPDVVSVCAQIDKGIDYSAGAAFIAVGGVVAPELAVAALAAGLELATAPDDADHAPSRYDDPITF